MTPADTLRAARALIEQPERWTRRVEARDSRGRTTSPMDAGAVCWCAAGATIRAAKCEVLLMSGAFQHLEKAVGINGIEHWNDMPGRTHAEVLAAFDRAIEIAEKSE